MPSRFVLIGCARYADPGLVDLPGVTRNIDRLSARMPPNSANSRTDVLHNHFSGKTALALVEEAANSAEDVLFVYYSGHGVLDFFDRLHLAVRATQLDDPDGGDWIDVDRLLHLILGSRAATKVLLLDCCESGRALASDAWKSSHMSGNVVVWTAVEAGVSARQYWENGGRPFNGKDPTAFTETLVDVADRYLASSRGLPRLHELVKEVQIEASQRGFSPPAWDSRGSGHAGLLPLQAAPNPSTFQARGGAIGPMLLRAVMRFGAVPFAVALVVPLLLLSDKLYPLNSLPFLLIEWSAILIGFLLQSHARARIPYRFNVRFSEGGPILDLGVAMYAFDWLQIETVTVHENGDVVFAMDPSAVLRRPPRFLRRYAPRPRAVDHELVFCNINALSQDRGGIVNAIASHAGWRWKESA